MHLKKIRLKNFKSHIDTTIEFGLITSIIGRNSSGKTNIFRALKILLHHGDWPASWIRYGQDSASIELTLVNGTKVTRQRTKTSQNVTIETKGKIETFEGKKDAAEFIEKAIGIRRITLDETTGPEDLNFVEVYDGPYLIGGRADTVQRKIAGIVGANKIDDARARISKKAKRLESKLESLSLEVTQLTTTVDSGNTFLNSANSTLQEAKQLDKKWSDNEHKLQILNDFSKHLNSITSLIPTTNVVKNITDLHEDLVELRKSLLVLNVDLDDAARLNKELDYSVCIEEYKSFITELQLVRDQNGLLININDYLTQLTELSEVESQITLLEAELESVRETLSLAKKEKIEKLKELGICPVCGLKTS